MMKYLPLVCAGAVFGAQAGFALGGIGFGRLRGGATRDFVFGRALLAALVGIVLGGAVVVLFSKVVIWVLHQIVIFLYSFFSCVP